MYTVTVYPPSRGIEGGDRGPRRERSDRPQRDNDGPEPEFGPAFLTRDND
jgi:polyribonucleotide nucleotidyltransferase